MKEIKQYQLFDTVLKKNLGIYTGAELGRKLGISPRQIPAYAKGCYRIRNRYIVEAVEKMTVKELCEEWDRVTELFRTKKKQ